MSVLTSERYQATQHKYTCPKAMQKALEANPDTLHPTYQTCLNPNGRFGLKVVSCEVLAVVVNKVNDRLVSDMKHYKKVRALKNAGVPRHQAGQHGVDQAVADRLWNL
jgi:hypothetical protein